MVGGDAPKARPLSGRSAETSTCRMIPSGGSARSVLWGMQAAQSRRRMVEAQLAACTQRVTETPGQARTAVYPVCQPVCGAKTAGSSASVVKILTSIHTSEPSQGVPPERHAETLLADRTGAPEINAGEARGRDQNETPLVPWVS